MTHTYTRRRTTIMTAALMVPAVGLPIGCETISQDLNGLTQGILPPSPAEAALMMTNQYDPDERRRGLVLIANSPFGGAEPHVKYYRLLVETETEPTVMAAAIRALAKHGTPDDVPLMLTHLQSPTSYVRWEAVKALQRLHNPAAVAPLINVLRNRDEQADIRTDAAIALGQYPEDRVFQALVASLNDRSLALNEAAKSSLHTLTGQMLGFDDRAWLQWYARHDAPEDAFAGRLEYRYPTYQRDETLLETLAFWSDPAFEQPAPPAGLRPVTTRSTYDDSDESVEGEAATSG